MFGSWQSCSACIQLHSTMRMCCCSRAWPPGGRLQHARGRRQQPGGDPVLLLLRHVGMDTASPELSIGFRCSSSRCSIGSLEHCMLF